MWTGPTRRGFLRLAGAGALASLSLAGAALAAETKGKQKKDARKEGKKGGKKQEQEKPLRETRLTLGLASYTTRKFDLDQTLAIANRLAMKYVCLKDFHLPLASTPEQIAQAAAKVKNAGLTLYAGGVISMKNEAEVNRAFDYAKAAGMRIIVAAPVAEMLPAINRKIQDYGIMVAVHNHGPGDKNFPTPESIYEKIQGMDKRFGLCIDIGHTVRIGGDPVKSIEKCGDRLLDMHMKDVSAASAEGQTVPCGWGVIDLPAVLKALLKINYSGVLSFEYEGHADDPVPGLAESVGYIRGLLAVV